MAHDVFISYAAEDKPIADMICAVVERHGVRCWMAPRDIAPGADWRESILSAIRASRAVVLVFSAHANASKHVNREVDCGIEAGIPVVPYRTEDIMPSGSLEYSLYGVHWLDAMTPPLEAHATRLAELLKSIVTSRAAAPGPAMIPSVPVPPAPTPGPSLSTVHARPPVSRNAMVMAGAVVVALIVVLWFVFGRRHDEGSGASAAATPSVPPAAPGAMPSPVTTPPPASVSPTATAVPTASPDTLPSSTPVAGATLDRGIVFQTPQAELVWGVRPDRANDFEQTWGQIVSALRQSDQPQARQLVRSLTLYRLPPSKDMPLYSIRIDPAASMIDYAPRQLVALSGRFDAATSDALFRRMSDSLGQLNALALEPVELVSNTMSLSPSPGAAPNTTMPAGGDDYSFTLDQAEIWWQLKPGQREEFESVFREILPGLLRSSNPYVRQMARGIKVFHVRGGGATELEIFRMDSVAKKMSYSPGVLMQYAGTFLPDAQSALTARLKNAVAQVNPMPLMPVR